MVRAILKIEDRSSAKWEEFIKDCLKSIFKVVPEEDLNGIEKVLILDECPNKKYNWAGGFYYSARNNQGAIIELYPPKIINAKPTFFPKTKFSTKYSVAKMFLHELGHHKNGYLPLDQREQKAEEYMLKYLQKIYGNWIYLFDLLARIDNFLKF